jgi:anti-sigma B factor antagonist
LRKAETAIGENRRMKTDRRNTQMEQNTNEPKLKITMNQDGEEYTFVLEGRMDTLTSPDLEDRVEEVLEQAKKLIFDMGKVEYISSAGLRVLLGAAQELEDRGEVVVRHITKPVQEVFDVTGFADAFQIE